MKQRVWTIVRLTAINVLVLVALLVVVEGAVSWFLVVRDVVVLPWVTDVSLPYTRYDPDLGWVNRPNANLRNMFGTGAWVQTNGQAFRNVGDTTPAVPPGRYRVICSGDSFTFGDGVDNEETWCQQLAARDPRIEPVNLGEGGYGADQAYLRFLRDAKDLQYQVHVFAFIADDFVRMQKADFLGFGKPVLAIEHGELVARNVPVPSFASRYPWIVTIPRALNDTRLGTLANRLKKKIGVTGDAAQQAQAQDERTRAIVRLMLANLKRMSEAGGNRLVLLHLSFINELREETPNPWTMFVAKTAQELQIPLVSVFDAMQSRTDVKDLFLSGGTAGGHYSKAGHAVVADMLYKQLRDTMPPK